MDKLIILVDQENKEIDKILEEVQVRLKALGIKIDHAEESKRVNVYGCKHGYREFRLTLVINGLDDVSTVNHTIEDH